MKQARQSNIELLRILTMCGVVLLHYNGYVGNALSLVTPNSYNQALLLGAEGLFICAVNLFVLITGYFGCTSQRRDPVKIICLLMQVIAFRCGYYLYHNLPSHTVTLKGLAISLVPANYFVILYVVLYIVSAYFNLAFRQLNRKQLGKMLAVAVILFSVWPIVADLVSVVTGESFMGINPVSAYGDDSGYTFVNFVLMYLVGAYIRLADVRIKKRYTGAVLVVLTAALAITGKYDSGYGIAWSYCNPLVIAQAATIFLLFREIPMRNSRVINELSKGAFTCFLFHTYPLAHFRVSEAVQKSPLYLLGHILFACISIYLISWLVYKVYDFATKPILKIANKLCKKTKLDFSVKEESAPTIPSP